MKVVEINTYSCQPTLGDSQRKVVIADNIADACDIYYASVGKYPELVTLVGVTLMKVPSRYVNDSLSR